MIIKLDRTMTVSSDSEPARKVSSQPSRRDPTPPVPFQVHPESLITPTVTQTLQRFPCPMSVPMATGGVLSRITGTIENAFPGVRQRPINRPRMCFASMLLCRQFNRSIETALVLYFRGSCTPGTVDSVGSFSKIARSSWMSPAECG